jgi:hypothetical protein
VATRSSRRRAGEEEVGGGGCWGGGSLWELQRHVRPPAAQLRVGGGWVQRRAEKGASVHSAQQSSCKWRLSLGIVSGGRVRECMGQLMGWQKMG